MLRHHVMSFLVSLLPLTAAAAPCESLLHRQVVAIRETGRTVAFDFPVLPAELGASEKRDAREETYRAWVRSHPLTDDRALLQNSIDVRRRALAQLPADAPFRLTLLADIRQLTRILSGEIGRIAPPSCLQDVAFREFLDVVDLTVHPQEFGAYVFTREGQTRMVGDFDLVTEDGGGAPLSRTLGAETERLLREGWILEAHLHNHPFVFDNPYGDVGGTPAPSGPDVATYRSIAPRRAWITNGIDVIEIERSEFPLLD